MKTDKLVQTPFPRGWVTGISITHLLLFLFLASASYARGAATKIDFVSEEILAPIGPPGKIWMSGDVQHIRDFPLAGPVWGDLNGTLTVVANINLNLTTGDGTAFGTFVLEVEWNGLVGTFEGRSHWKYEGFLITSGQGTARGTGDFEGMLMKANFFNEDGRTPLIGTIIIPGGE